MCCEKLGLRHRVIPQKKDDLAPRFGYAMVAGRGGPGVDLREKTERGARAIERKTVARRGAGGVIDDGDFEVRRVLLELQRVEDREEGVGAFEGGNDDGKSVHAKISARVERTSGGAPASSSRKKSESNLSSPG